MPHQDHKDVEGKPQPTDEDLDLEGGSKGQTTGQANTQGQRAVNQQGGSRGTLDQAGPETGRQEKRPETTARPEGDLDQLEIYREPSDE